MPSLEDRPTRRTRRPGAATDASSQRRTQYRRLINPFQPLRIFSDDHVAHIHRSALNILETHGIKILSPEARSRFAAAGAILSEEEQLVRIGTDIVDQALKTTRPRVDLHALTPEQDVTIGEGHCAITPVSGPPNVTDSIRGRRAGTLQDFSDFVRLSQTFDVIHLLGPSVEPQDIPTNLRHLEVTRAQLTLSNKIPFVYSRGTPQVTDCFAMIRIAHGVNEVEFARRVFCYTNINTNSPRQIDIPMAQGIMDFAAAGQLSIITPFTLAGAMAPITVPGALALAHAEALAGITLSQLVRPGAPVAYGSFTSNVDMKSGSPAFGTPEYVKACFGAGQLARHVGLPWRSSGATASNAPDEQATYETAMSLWGALLGGCNILIHGAGWLESGLSASLEKFIIDIEMLQILAEVLQPVTMTDAEIGLDAIAEVPPGGHFFSVPHTMARYRTAFYSPLLSDWRNFGQWQEDGAKTASQRASDVWQRTLKEYRQPTLESAISEMLDDYVNRRGIEGGASPTA
jgi:trimethylamine---corrinoid protein Co-methyltransferase